MNIYEYTVCLYFFISCCDLCHYLHTDKFAYFTLSRIKKSTRILFYVLTFPTTIFTIILLLYGFYIYPWWQPIISILVTSIPGNIINRKYITANHHIFAIIFSFFGISILTYNFLL